MCLLIFIENGVLPGFLINLITKKTLLAIYKNCLFEIFPAKFLKRKREHF